MKQQQEEEERKRQRKEKKKEKKVSVTCCHFFSFYFELKIITDSPLGFENQYNSYSLWYQMVSERTGSPTWTWGRWPWHCCYDGFWRVRFLKKVSALCWLHIFSDLRGFALEDIVQPHKHVATKNHFDRSAIRFEWTGCKDATFDTGILNFVHGSWLSNGASMGVLE